MAKKENKIEEPVKTETPVIAEKTEKEKLLELYETLKALNIRSIGDLENLIARA